MPPFYFWSKWRDSNSRHPAPKELEELFSNLFGFILAPFIPEKLLFRTLVSIVSVCSESVYGQKCGQIQLLPGSKLNRGAFCLLRCGDCSLENENRQVLSVPKLYRYKQRKDCQCSKSNADGQTILYGQVLGVCAHTKLCIIR